MTQGAATSVEASDGNGGRVLLAEDDEEMRSLLAAILRDQGCRVVDVASGNDMLDRIEGELLVLGELGFDVLVSDIRMPGRSGLEVLSGLRNAGFHVPVVLTTAFGDEATHRVARELDAIILDKPFDLDHFISVIQGAVRRGKTRAPKNAESEPALQRSA